MWFLKILRSIDNFYPCYKTIIKLPWLSPAPAHQECRGAKLVFYPLLPPVQPDKQKMKVFGGRK